MSDGMTIGAVYPLSSRVAAVETPGGVWRLTDGWRMAGEYGSALEAMERRRLYFGEELGGPPRG
jgi:hypothetical protein